MATGKALFTLVCPKHVRAEGGLSSWSASEFLHVICAQQNSLLKCVSIYVQEETEVF
jgi:hypothetical protein